MRPVRVLDKEGKEIDLSTIGMEDELASTITAEEVGENVATEDMFNNTYDAEDLDAEITDDASESGYGDDDIGDDSDFDDDM